MARQTVLVFSICGLFAVLEGCKPTGGGPPGVPRENVSGTASFDGKPIPFGYIDFRNEQAKVVTTLQIKDGVFKSGSGDGPVEGMNTVIVAGHVAEGGMPLWSGPFKKEVEIKKGDNNGVDVSVDKGAVKPFDPKKWSENIHDRN